MIQLSTHHKKPAETRFITALSDRMSRFDDSIVKSIYSIVSQFNGIEGDYKGKDQLHMQEWFRQFILADFGTLQSWVDTESEIKTDIKIFVNIYERDFSNGDQRFLDSDETYNAYSFLKDLKIGVCPYCEDEYLVVESKKDKKGSFRTAQIDHFYPKSRYPLLAMCFYNLIPCGSDCNRIKLSYDVEACPYDKDIEKQSYLYPDIPVGINMECLSPEDCLIKFHPKNGMIKNVSVLKLEDRYKHTATQAYEILKNSQQFTPECLDSILSTGDDEIKKTIIRSLLKIPEDTEKYSELHVKLRNDLLRFTKASGFHFQHHQQT